MSAETPYELLLNYLEGRLDTVQAVCIEMAIEEDPELRAAYQWLVRLRSDLDALAPPACSVHLERAIADRIARLSADEEEAIASEAPSLPEPAPAPDASADHWAAPWAEAMVRAAAAEPSPPCVDLRAAVLREVDPEGRVDTAQRFRWSRHSQGGLRWAWWTLAAAAGILVAFAALWMTGPRRTPPDENPRLPVARAFDPPARAEGDSPGVKGFAPADPVHPLPSPTATQGRGFDSTAPADIEMAELVDTLRKTPSGPKGWAALRELARLDPAEARRIASAPESPPGAVAGAAMMLPADEQIPPLRRAVGEMSHPAPGWILLSRAAATRGDSAVAIDAAEHALQAKPDNGLAMLLQAREHLALGEINEALALLENAQESGRVSGMSLENAHLRAQALEGSGAGKNPARVAAALSVGLEEYDFLCTLGTDLLDYARYYESAGNQEAAAALRESVLWMGEELAQNAPVLAERLAGLDTQAAAIDAIQQGASAERVRDLAPTASALVEGLVDIQKLIGDLSGLFEMAIDPASWVELANAILGEGNVDIQYLLQVLEGSAGL